MAFALTKFKAYGVNVGSAVRKQAIQYAEFHISALSTDVDLDLGDDDGTFWTAATGDATYGDLATTALAVLQKIDDQVNALVDIKYPYLITQAQETEVENFRPNIRFDNGEGVTPSSVLQLEWALKDGLQPVVIDLGTTA